MEPLRRLMSVTLSTVGIESFARQKSKRHRAPQ